jgi:acyl-CoA synthetase (AMP-forming)/AMP-acid ligase II
LLEPGDRILTWSPSEPALPAVYLGAMRAGLILVPLDLRMTAGAIAGIVASGGSMDRPTRIAPP